TPAKDVLDAAILNPNPVIHPALIVTNAAPIEHYGEDYNIHQQGTTPATLRLIYAVDDERIAVRKALGYDEPHFRQDTYYDPALAGQGLFGNAAQDLVLESGLWQERISLEHRYLDEDVPYGLRLITDIGRVAGVPTPATDAVIHIASILRQSKLSSPDRNLALIGIEGLDSVAVRAKLK
ncbi:NAD/NADP octopine/nopaline dehydrogenase family protein, partial [Thermodesulfobacteriota bacterium]